MSFVRTVLHVHGMRCRSCVRHVEDALRRVAGVASARVDLTAGEVCIEYDDARASTGVLVAAIAEAGYEVVL